ncbi:hypothetical protein DFS33DRAFT_186911 [Desarmillaria ectypa]|nr:hypothetical protein DFS33DRAFT_186911 [Desarmillaria ectypa]
MPPSQTKVFAWTTRIPKQPLLMKARIFQQNVYRLTDGLIVAMSVSKCRGVSDANVFHTKSGENLAFSISANWALAPPLPPTRSRGRTRGDLGTSPFWGKNNATLDIPSTSALRRISPTASEPKRHSHKHPAGLGLGHPPSSSLHTPSSSPSPSLSSESSGIGMLTSSLSISSNLCRLTSQPPLKLPSRQPQPRSRTRGRLFSSKMPYLTVSKFTKRLLYTIPESLTSFIFQGHRHVIGKDARSEGKVFEGGMVRSFGWTLF